MAEQQEDGAYPRVNGALLQTQQYNGMIVSAVGKVVGPNTLQAADGTSITLDTDNIAESLVVDPDMCVEIIGSAQDATTIMAFISRSLGSDMDLELYNKMIAMQQSPQYCRYFQNPVSGN
mmetsp:Transcript_111229/g.321595  ORF Transcript_111229/g.321595 Transcript_111229/m.321595 type:complete len:120 (-) Transcript_111229:104-463(-)|eukprot:CAMPEP_0176007756 /NCGR_PEP_ID=MMETSP0120_2-20121206/3395_1 /TAXON_ID=160619 /ORGANISM="Kryptoperidinium foliaceum, Strain CCMP 1326" /LENGTH=119 /DNA_ID=CAMNT_0017340523 /DNA_START=83 /DNA_END=442 /DNA_ORIENTATION=+